VRRGAVSALKHQRRLPWQQALALLAWRYAAQEICIEAAW
jgi:hypothetical protein